MHATVFEGESNFYEFENKICPSILTVTLDMLNKNSDADIYVTKGLYYDLD